MATKTPYSAGNGIVRWPAGGENDTAEWQPLDFARGGLAAVQMLGTFGGTVTMMVTNDTSDDGVVLLDLAQAGIAMTDADLKDFTSAAAFIRPEYGSGVSAVEVILSAAT